jgi:PAS domain S-box-containing protein
MTQSRKLDHPLAIDMASLDRSLTPIYVVDETGRILYFNEAMEQLFGYTPDQYIGQVVAMLAVDPKATFEDIRTRLDEGHGSWQGEIEARTAEGRVFPCWISATRFIDKEDSSTLTMGMVGDVSGKQEILDELKSRSDRLGALASLAARIGTYRDPSRLAREGLSVISELTRITQGFILLIDEVTGKLKLHSSFNLDKEELEAFQQDTGWEYCTEGRAIEEKVPILVRETGTDPKVCCPMKDQASSVAVIPLIIQDHLIGVLSASTEPPDELSQTDMEFLVALAFQVGIYLENARLNRNLEKQNQQLQVQNRDLKELLSIISHDLRSPLATIGGYASLLMKKGEEIEPVERRQFSETIFRKTRETSKRFDDLLSFFRIGLESEGTRLEVVDVGSVIEQALEEAAPEQVVAQCQVEVTEHLPALMGYPAHMTHLFVNLLSNAIKFSLETDEPHIRISYERTEENGSALHCFSVTDNGPGIPADYHESIFKPFHRVPSMEDVPGTGVGLAAVKRIVRLHGGTVSVRSEPGKGSTFTFSLPWEEVEVDST